MRDPLSPFLLINFFIFFEQPLSLALLEFVKRGREVMVDEDVFGANDPQSSLFNPAAVVIIFEEAAPKGFVEQAYLFEGAAPKHHAEERSSA